MERKMQKEREEDEHLHGDQPKYVTKAYKEHLVESNKWKAIEAEREKREAKEDVRKRGDLTGFYRNLLNNNVAFGGEDAESTASHELSADAKQRVLDKLTAGGRNVSADDVAYINDSKANHTIEADPNASGTQADWSKQLQDSNKTDEIIEPVAKEEEPEEPEEEEDPEIARLKAQLAAARAMKERADADNKKKRDATEAFGDKPGDNVPDVEIVDKKPKPKEPEVVDLTARNKGGAVDDAKARYLARKAAAASKGR